jgi:tetratricopeptide (TPR) repeat protein
VRAKVHNNACAAFSDMSMFDEAKTQCLAGLRTHSGGGETSDDMLAAILRSNIAEIDLRAGRARDAIDGYETSLATRERLLGTMNPSLLVPLRGLAQGHLLLDDHEAAAKVARRAVEIGDAASVDALARGHARLLLARALWRDPSQRREATALAKRASVELAEAGPQAMALVVDLEAWRAAPATAPLIPR